jgi:gas vesicle structural protein
MTVHAEHGLEARDLPPTADDDELSLVELVNRVLDRGAVVSGDITISVAGVDLVYVGLRVLLASVESMVARENTAMRHGSVARSLPTSHKNVV